MSTIIDVPPATTPEDRPAPAPDGGSHRPSDDGGRRDGLLVVVYVVATIALLASMVAVGLATRAVAEADDAGTTAAAGGDAAGAAPASVEVTLADLDITPSTVEVAEGGVLETDTVNVAPGERYTVLVQATAPGTWAWHCHILTPPSVRTGCSGW